MPRWWNRLQSKVYARAWWLSERYGRRAGSFDDIPLPPLAPLRRPLREARVAIVTAGGVHLSEQAPFDMTDPEGDGSYRVVPLGTPPSALRITHDYYDHAAADRDINCVFPLDRLGELARAGEIGEAGPRHVGMMGHLSGAALGMLVDRSAGAIAALFQQDAVDLVLAVPG
jgi:D-proline reductase (dithiol) PrdB